MESLDAIGIQAGTDKSRLRQNYLRHYQRMLDRFSGRPITIIEIGIHNGASLKTWERYFPSASIVGVDIEPSTSRFARERVTVEIGSQADGTFLTDLARRYAPAVIIDDGSHIPEHQVFTFEHLFPCLAPGGVYIVEDIGHPLDPNIATEQFLSITRSVLLRRSTLPISHMEIIPGALSLWKDISDELDGNFAALEEAVQNSELTESWLYFAEYLQRTGAPLNLALSAAQKAAMLEPQNAWMHSRVSEILFDMGRHAEAVDAAKKAIELGHGDKIFDQFLANRLSRIREVASTDNPSEHN